MMDKPILLSGDMVRAILDGSKTQTRRPLKPQPHICQNGDVMWKDRLIGSIIPERSGLAYPEYHEVCLYQPGDRLWVRETLVRKRNDPSMGIDYITYASDCTGVSKSNPKQQGVLLYRPTWQWQKDTLPSIHMPRWASRIPLEVVRVWPEQIQEISIEDLWAEGMDRDMWAPTQFQILWNKLYAKKGQGWKTNLWVGATEFKVVE